MADVQRHLEDFHDAIRLTDENETLREKRDAVLRKLDSGLVKIFEDREEDSPTYTTINRGSYAMHTGVVPLEGDYDIDVGVIFDVCKDDYPDPVEVKLWVYDALDGYTGNVDIKQPCVTVQYQINEEPVYHVDLAVYGYDSSSSESLYLARGKPYSRSENKIWEPAAPKELLSLIREYSSDPADRRQFRRVIRYLKRWKDLKFPSDGNGAPIGIGITVAAHRWFQPTYRLVDTFNQKRRYDDLLALEHFVTVMLEHFCTIIESDEILHRLKVKLPVRPFCDLFQKMTDKQMDFFYTRLNLLRDVLNEALEETDPVEACLQLQTQFGEDLVVPDVKETGQNRARAIVSSSSSA